MKFNQQLIILAMLFFLDFGLKILPINAVNNSIVCKFLSFLPICKDIKLAQVSSENSPQENNETSRENNRIKSFDNFKSFDNIVVKSNTLYPFISNNTTVRLDDPQIPIKLCLPEQNSYNVTIRGKSSYNVTIRGKENVIGKKTYAANCQDITLFINDFLDDKKLIAGETYSLTISPTISPDSTEKTSTISFSVLSKQNASILDKEIKEIKEYKDINQDTKKLAVALLYKEYGLTSYAIQELTTLIREKQTPNYDVYIYKYLADSYLEMNLFQKAKYNYDKALEKLKELPRFKESPENNRIIAEIHESLGYLYLYDSTSKSDQLEASIKQFEEAKNLYCKETSSEDCTRLEKKIAATEQLRLRP